MMIEEKKDTLIFGEQVERTKELYSNKFPMGQPHIINLLYGKGTRKAYFNGIEDTLNDTGTITSSLKPLALGGQVNDTTGMTRVNLESIYLKFSFSRTGLPCPPRRLRIPCLNGL